MFLNSPLFLTVAFPLVLLTHFLIKEKFYIGLLLTASVLLYSWYSPLALGLLLVIAIVNYLLALWLQRTEKVMSIMILWFGILFDLLLLILFKYSLWGYLKISLFSDVILPLGMSFYIFQMISYLTDVYKRIIPADHSVLNFLLYTSFFSKMACGPIVRYKDFSIGIPASSLNRENFTEGIRRFGIGLAKKVLIADCMAKIADPIFNSPVETIPCVYCWVGAAAYTMQIYFDFSGYTDMAIGLARIFNFRFPENFNFPYSSKSIQEFWRRWHISLSTWFRDYLYIPLGGNRRGTLRTYLNMCIVFLLCGIWHGAAWTFLAWGAYHGLGLVIERAGGKKLLERLPGFVCNIYTIFFVMMGWVLFRSNSFQFAGSYVKQMFCGNPNAPYYSYAGTMIWFFDYSSFIIFLLGLLFSYPAISERLDKYDRSCWMLPSFLVFVIAVIFALSGLPSPGLYGKF